MQPCVLNPFCGCTWLLAPSSTADVTCASWPFSDLRNWMSSGSLNFLAGPRPRPRPLAGPAPADRRVDS